MQYEHTINELNLLRAQWPMEPGLILRFCVVLIEGESMRYPVDIVTLLPILESRS